MSPLFLIIPGFLLWWTFLLNLIGWLSGWWALARHYRARAHFVGTRFYLRSAKFGWSNYSGLLTVGVNAEGLYLAVLFPWRPGHPPLFIPWAEIDTAVTEGWFSNYFDLRFRQVPHLRLRFQKSFGLKIAAAANRSWQPDEPTNNEPEA